MKAPHKCLRLVLTLLLFMVAGLSVFATDEHYAAQPLDGSKGQVKVDSSSTVMDAVFFDSTLNPLQTTYSVKNRVTLSLNEYSLKKLPDQFDVTVGVKVYATRYDFSGHLVIDSSLTIYLNVTYKKFDHYRNRNAYTFDGAFQSTIKIISITSNIGTLSDYDSVLMVENEIDINRAYNFDCTNNAVQSLSMDSSDVSGSGELTVSWGKQRAADEYDLEWTYVDSSAVASDRTSGVPDAKKIFSFNATRVSIAQESYKIPLLYDDKGTLYFRVRSVQVTNDGQRHEAHWSSDFSGGLDSFMYAGHERTFNWQATTSYAEEGKRKSVVQYYDGSLRSRQTVTKDNTTDTTLVAETMYDYQGRPVIQVLPAPSLSRIIGYTPNFSVDINGAEYDKTKYDGPASSFNYCGIGAAAMGSQSGASKYYSPANQNVNNSFHEYIPNAHHYPFTETKYTEDNTGRIAVQGGVDSVFQIGVVDLVYHTTHDTKYYYGSADQEDIDALFGSEAGNANHYFKNMVRDANGQYSVSYVDMHGRTVATALAGKPAMPMDSLESSRLIFETKKLIDSTNNIIKGTVIESSKSLVITKAGANTFHYSLHPDSLQLKGCDSNSVCYTCRYNLQITISDDCNNQTLPGGQPIVVTDSNFTIGHIGTTFDTTGFDKQFTDTLQEGTYTVTKRLSISQYGLDYYRDSVFVQHNTCYSLTDFINQQKSLLLGQITCAPTCTHCSIDTFSNWTLYRPWYLNQLGIATADTANYLGMAQLAFNQEREACDEVCGNTLLSTTIRNQMLADVTPPYGQYARPDSVDNFSIFFNDLSGVKKYKDETYVDYQGNADAIYLADGTSILPSALSIPDFVTDFKTTWADSLLKLHPEYCKLQLFESNPSFTSGQVWDNHFEAVNTYKQAIDSGFLNPLGYTDAPVGASSTIHDPFFNSSIDPVYASTWRTLLNDSMRSKVPLSSGYMDMWSLASAMAQCAPADTTCFNHYSGNAHPFDMDTSCGGTLDMAWRYFREMYINQKRAIISKILDQVSCTYSASDLAAAGHILNFPDPAMLLAKVPSTQAAGADSVTSMVNNSCQGYVAQWWLDMGPCNYTTADSNIITPRLIKVCEEGGDSAHIFGSSTVSPSSTYTYKSFDDVIKAYNDSLATAASPRSISRSVCNGYLLSAPGAYDNVPVSSNVDVWGKPDSCQCSTINAFYQQYQVYGQSDTSFSAYLLRTTGTIITNGALDSLRNLCNNVITCKSLSTPIAVPPVLQCNVHDVCVPCSQMETLYNQFTASFPGATPSYDNIDSLQRTVNHLFENFMNLHLGFGKQTQEYLAFMDTCRIVHLDTLLSSCDSLSRLKDGFLQSNGYATHLDASGADSCEYRFTTYFNSAHATTYSYSQIDSLYYSTCGVHLGNICDPANCNTALLFDRAKRQNVRIIPVNGRLTLDSSVFTLETTIKPVSGNFYILVGNRTTVSGAFSDGFFWLVLNNGEQLLQLQGCPNYITTNTSGINVYDGKPHHLSVVKYADSLRFYVDSISIPYTTSHCGGSDPATPLSGRNINSPGPIQMGIDSTDVTSSFGSRYISGWMSEMRIWNISRTASQIKDYIHSILSPQPGLVGYYVFQSPDTLSQIVIDLSTNIESQRNNAILGTSIAKASNDPAWVSSLQAYKDGSPDMLTPSVSYCNCNSNGPLLCGRTTPVFPPVALMQHSPCDDSTFFATTTGTLRFQAYSDSLNTTFTDKYLAKCLNAYKLESFTVTQPMSEFHYTLYYYDQAGNLVKTVPPAGVDMSVYSRTTYFDSVTAARQNGTLYTPNHTLPTNYRYNALNQVVAQQTPDASTSHFWYDRLGRLVISQNARQQAVSSTENNRQYSYTKYDYLGRIDEVGQVDNLASSAIPMTDSISRHEALLTQWLDTTLYARNEQVTRTYYDLPYAGSDVIPLEQTNLRNRVSYTTFTNNSHPTAYNQATIYSYDIHGNVDTLLQDYGCGSGTSDVWNIMNQNSNRWKRIVYDYDLISGKVNMVSYQPRYWDVISGQYITPADCFYHRYTYDAENRLTLAETSQDSILWEKDARYEYYKHGPLARVVLGEQEVQGLDYAYTLQGWLKGMNSGRLNPAYDMGMDGNAAGQRSNIARDIFGYNLNYFTGDYCAIDSNANPFPGVSGILNGGANPLYNGNISSMAVNIGYFAQPVLYNYKYDQLNRIKAMDLWQDSTPSAIDWSGLRYSQKWKERFHYDGNGNLLHVDRYHSFDNVPMDSMDYHYAAGTNKLAYIGEASTSYSWVNGTTDIEDQPVNNYGYDAIGNLIRDSSENIGTDSIKWNVYGKITSISRSAASANSNTRRIDYTYDAAGNRIGKKTVYFGSPHVDYTWYVRDAQGNVLNVYTASMDTSSGTHLGDFDLFLQESMLYGSSRLGLMNVKTYAEPPNTRGSYYDYFRGQKFYEISNHLGNVVTVIDDKKLGVIDSSISTTQYAYYNPEIVDATDYWSFGMVRLNYNAGIYAYRYGFNGKEKDNDVKGEGDQMDYGMRIYDPRIGRFLSVDPLTSGYPSWSSYVYAMNRPIDGIDLDGGEWKSIKDKNGATVDYTYVGFDERGKPIPGSEPGGRLQKGDKQYVFGSRSTPPDPESGVRLSTATIDVLDTKTGDISHVDIGNKAKGMGVKYMNLANLTGGEYSVASGSTKTLKDGLVGLSGITLAEQGAAGKGIVDYFARGLQPGTAESEGLGPLDFFLGAGELKFGAGIKTLLEGGLDFAAYKAARGGTETLEFIKTENALGNVVEQRISTEFSHVFITQRVQRAFNLPNWLVNNRLNVWKLNSVQHALIDSYRFNFLRYGFKPQVGWFGKYNWFTKFGK